MDKFFGFFNKIMGFLVFLIFLVVLFEHLHHGHRHGKMSNERSHNAITDSSAKNN